MLNCIRCNSEMIWGCDYGASDFGYSQEGIISTWSCPKCNATAEFYTLDSDLDD